MEFVDLEKICPNILCDIRYATTNNFTGKVLYSQAKCYLRFKVAEKLVKIQERLEKEGLGLKVWDGYRPLSVQKIFWNLLPDDRYVANPAIGSRHNRGAAVDLTLVNKKGEELPMPTPFDSFVVEAHRNCMNLSPELIENRDLLEKAMGEEGFIGLPTEWWHFDDAEWSLYPVVDIPLEQFA
jgi:D-alanyl-D-alanine dipeptidase